LEQKVGIQSALKGIVGPMKHMHTSQVIHLNSACGGLLLTPHNSHCLRRKLASMAGGSPPNDNSYAMQESPLHLEYAISILYGGKPHFEHHTFLI